PACATTYLACFDCAYGAAVYTSTRYVPASARSSCQVAKFASLASLVVCVHIRSPSQPPPVTARRYCGSPPPTKHASPSSTTPPAAGITPHDATWPPAHATSAARSPSKRSRSMPPLMPGTVPVDEYCQNVHAVHGVGVSGQ